MDIVFIIYSGVNKGYSDHLVVFFFFLKDFKLLKKFQYKLIKIEMKS